ncbi:DUF4145 domain-containing protein [Pseudomonas donghuensis]|uniref:DUF4145 domain-containing protein n=1 Tax=Pseudomonas donghuensis TaxID=1163398 RepID=UPI0020C208C9|nr:DUF4145 domain-containing protein [Pseudomonas donghuensis]MCP6695128.1 DUF4145 domain-containing protein [Pseudomonas donghuensis]
MLQKETIKLDRCPHCNVAQPNLTLRNHWDTTNANQTVSRWWAFYVCASCGGVITTVAWLHRGDALEIHGMWPAAQSVDDAIPGRAKDYLEQAITSIQAPAGAVILAASSVDAMLKEKGLKEGTLYKRIDAAAEQHLITAEMAAWAHEVRLGANDQRHADDEAPLPSQQDAQKAIEFVQALAQFLFVLPSRVERGRGK